MYNILYTNVLNAGRWDQNLGHVHYSSHGGMLVMQLDKWRLSKNKAIPKISKSEKCVVSFPGRALLGPGKATNCFPQIPNVPPLEPFLLKALSQAK